MVAALDKPLENFSILRIMSLEMKMEKIKTFIIFTGYVEGNSNSCLIATHEIGFDSVEEALDNLASIIIGGCISYFCYSWIKKCCRSARDGGVEFCPNCGLKLFTYVDFTFCRDIVSNFIDGDTDSTGEVYEEIENAGWHYGGNALCTYGQYPTKSHNPFLNGKTAVIFEDGAEVLANIYLGDLKMSPAHNVGIHKKMEELNGKELKVYRNDEKEKP